MVPLAQLKCTGNVLQEGKAKLESQTLKLCPKKYHCSHNLSEVECLLQRCLFVAGRIKPAVLS